MPITPKQKVKHSMPMKSNTQYIMPMCRLQVV